MLKIFKKKQNNSPDVEEITPIDEKKSPSSILRMVKSYITNGLNSKHEETYDKTREDILEIISMPLVQEIISEEFEFSEDQQNQSQSNKNGHQSPMQGIQPEGESSLPFNNGTGGSFTNMSHMGDFMKMMIEFLKMTGELKDALGATSAPADTTTSPLEDELIKNVMSSLMNKSQAPQNNSGYPDMSEVHKGVYKSPEATANANN